MPRKDEHLPVRAALEVTLASDRRLAQPKCAALVALCRVTADQVDAAGAEVSSRLIASYLSALKDIERALADRTPATSGGAGSGGALGRLQGLAGGKSA